MTNMTLAVPVKKTTKSTYAIIVLISAMAWLLSTIICGIWSSEVITETSSLTYDGPIAYGTPNRETISFSVEKPIVKEQLSSYRQYWLDYYTAKRGTESIGSSETSFTEASWYANSTIVFWLIVLLYIFAAILGGSLDEARINSLRAKIFFTLAVLIPIAYSGSKIEFLYWLSH